MRRWWHTLPVSKKLYGVVGVMAFLIASELITLYFAMTTLSAVRAFVGAEGLWSKAQKTAVTHLQKYSITHDDKYYQLFLSQLQVPLGDHEARLALEKPSAEFNEEAATLGLLQGQNHPKDIPRMIHLIRRFHDVPQLALALERWRAGDDLLVKFIAKAEELKREVRRAPYHESPRIDAVMDAIFALDDQLTRVETEFSLYLGQASRWLEELLMVSLLLVVLTVEGTVVVLTISFGSRLTKALNEINAATVRVGSGDFSQRIPVRSHDELGQLAGALNVMTDNLQKQTNERQNAEHASETKNLFLANMSHEIRTPLSAILGFSEMLGDPNLPAQDRAHYASIIKRTGTSLLSIIDDILDVSRVEAEQLEVELKPLSLSQLLSDLQEVLRARSEAKNVHLEFRKWGEVSDVIQSDPVRLRQILSNIIGNSIKFTEGGLVTVTYEARPPDLIFKIQDNGVGIPAEQVSRLFRPFSQGDDSIRKKFGGTGLGLMISRRLAQRLGGDLVLEDSIPGQGSTFAVRVAYSPMPTSVLPPANPSLAETPLLAGKKILVVEDSPDNQLLAKVFLSATQAELDFAGNGQEGVDKALHGNFNLILMDIQMPVMDGYAATDELRRRGCLTPVVALTGFAMKKDLEKCLEAGCNDYLSKPFDRNSLLESVRRHIV